MFSRRNRGHEHEHLEETAPFDPVQDAKLGLAKAIEHLIEVDENDDPYLPFAGDVAVEKVFAAIHKFASVTGYAEDDTEARLDLALAVDAQIKYSAVPNPFRTYCDAQNPDYVRALARPVIVEVTSAEQQAFFQAQPIRIPREEGYVAPGYEELADLSHVELPNQFLD